MCGFWWLEDAVVLANDLRMADVESRINIAKCEAVVSPGYSRSNMQTNKYINALKTYVLYIFYVDNYIYI